ncbi:MAG: hypothetical protein Rubg2KO_32730 [Rubricoccaceae bacterium]
MSRLSLFAVLALVASLALPAAAQDSMPVTADSVMADSSDASNPELAAELYAQADAAADTSNFETALGLYEQALEMDQTNPRIALGRANTLGQLRRFEDARAAYETAVELAEAADDNAALTAANNQLARLVEGLEARAATQATAEAFNNAVSLLSASPTPGQAQEALGMLNQATEAGYDSTRTAFYYAQAYNAMDQGAEALPYAEIAIAASEGEADRSGYYIQLGLAHMKMGNEDQARAAFEQTQGGAWESWGTHYIGQLDGGGTD